jgi:hypothetical protein
MTADTKQAIEAEVEDILTLEKTLRATEAELAQNDQFRQFIELQKSFNEKSAEVWKNIERQMIEADIKSIKGDWGSLTITERLSFTTSEDLPAKFYKKVVDSKKLADTFRLEGKAPKGAEPRYTKYLTRRIK